MFTLKPLSTSAIPAALAKAERYRLLNEPEQAQSICEDVLAADPDHEAALIGLILAITDQFPESDGSLVARAQSLAARLATDYDRAYYAGLIAERRGRALLRGPGPGRAKPAGDWFRAAMTHYERAEALRPPDNDDARLRWNACARILNAHRELMAPDEERSTPMMLE